MRYACPPASSSAPRIISRRAPEILFGDPLRDPPGGLCPLGAANSTQRHFAVPQLDSTCRPDRDGLFARRIRYRLCAEQRLGNRKCLARRQRSARAADGEGQIIRNRYSIRHENLPVMAGGGRRDGKANPEFHPAREGGGPPGRSPPPPSRSRQSAASAAD